MKDGLLVMVLGMLISGCVTISEPFRSTLDAPARTKPAAVAVQ